MDFNIQFPPIQQTPPNNEPPTPPGPPENAIGQRFGTVLPSATAAEEARAQRRRETGRGIFRPPAFIARQRAMLPVDGTTQEYPARTLGPGSVFRTANGTVGAAVAVQNPETGRGEIICVLTDDGDDVQFLTANVQLYVFGLRTERGMLAQYRF